MFSRVLRAGARFLRRATGGGMAPAPPPVSAESNEPLDTARWLAARPSAVPLYGHLVPDIRARLDAIDPGHARDVLAAADDALAHRFVLLGCGPFTPVDPGRAAEGGYQPIDWQLDPSCGLRFPHGFPHKDWNPATMRPGRADIKLPWELARSHHLVNLAQAWRLTGDDRYARETVRQVRDFVECNPAGVGIQWTCTMDVAIRAANWVLAYELLERCAGIDPGERTQWVEALHGHGHFIRANLENTYEVTSNHYLSNVIGLWYLGTFFRGTPSGDAWRAYAGDSLEREIRVQVHEEGSDFESSVPYHRLVTELFLGAARVGQVHGHRFSDVFRSRLLRMVEFLRAVLRPDGLMPQVGDADDGRLQVFAGAGRWRPQDPRHIFGAASVVFGDTRWLESGGGAAAAEAVWWGATSASPVTGRLPDGGSHFPDIGIAVSRIGPLYLLVTNGRVGTKGFGNHKHNELLSFEYHAAGVAWLVDPGSFVYTGDPDGRNLFRSTGYHNTLQIDDVEQNELNPEWLFRLFEKANPSRIEWTDTPRHFEYTGRHEGFRRAGGPVHGRRFSLDKAARRLDIIDVLDGGSGERRVRWHFHCGPGVSVEAAGARIVLTSGTRTCSLRVPDDLNVEVGEGWYSPSYGVREPCATIDLSVTLTLPTDATFAFVIQPE